MNNFFAVPDKEKNYYGHMVYVLAMIWMLVSAAIVSVGFYFFPDAWPRWLSLIGAALFIGFFNISLNRLGYTRQASWSLTIMLWLFITIPCFSAGGMQAPGILQQPSIILTAGFLLGWRGGVIIGVLTICTDFVLAYLQINGHLPSPSVAHTSITLWIAAIIPFGTILALQYYATNHLRAGLTAVQREMLRREEAEKIKDQTLSDLGERVKELKTLYSVSRILQDEEALSREIIGRIAQELPPGWQYPDITAARVRIAETEYTTNNYQPSEYSLQAELKTVLGTKVMIEVVYLQAMPDFDEGPFLKEERHLINMLVEMLKVDVERREREFELKDYKYALDISSIVSLSHVNGAFTFVNENFCKASKYSPEELVGKDHSILWSGLHSSEYFDDLKVTMENGLPFRGEFCNKAKDGSLYWVNTSIVPFLDENGKVYQYLSIGHDITQRKEAEYLIKEQAETFRALIENTKESILLISPEYKLIQFNTTARARIRHALGMELTVGSDFRQYLYPGSEDLFYSMFNDSLKGIYRMEEVRSKGIADEYFWFQSKSSPVYDLKGELIGIRLLTETIDDRKKAEAVLRESEEKFRSIVEQSLVGIYIIQNGKLVYVNPGFEKVFGYSKEELLNKESFEELIHKDNSDLIKNIYAQKDDIHKAKQQYVLKAFRSDGAVLHLEVIASFIAYNDAPAVIGTLVDITERVEEERRINLAVLDAQESERLQIGMELHDNVKQILAGVAMFLNSAQEKLDDKKAVMNILNNVREYNSEAIAELRRLSHQLAPSVEKDMILSDKIEWLVRSLKLNEILSVSVKIDDFKTPIDNKTQLAFYRILQEQLSNVMKYAKASRVEVNVHSVNEMLHLQVKDNGRGFDTNTTKGGIGLENIRRRVQVLNGKVEVISLPGKGCEINVQVPMN